MTIPVWTALGRIERLPMGWRVSRGAAHCWSPAPAIPRQWAEAPEDGHRRVWDASSFSDYSWAATGSESNAGALLVGLLLPLWEAAAGIRRPRGHGTAQRWTLQTPVD